jgi:hypothetical protein
MTNNFDRTSTSTSDPGEAPLTEPGQTPLINGLNGQKPISRNRKGQFLPGSVPNPNGRPKNKRSESALLTQALIQEAGPDVARRVIREAKAGNATAFKLVLERLVPVAADRRLQLDQITYASPHPNTADNYTPKDILHAHNQLVEAVATGELSPVEAHAISQLLEARRRSWEALQLSRRIKALEQNATEPQ